MLGAGKTQKIGLVGRWRMKNNRVVIKIWAILLLSRGLSQMLKTLDLKEFHNHPWNGDLHCHGWCWGPPRQFLIFSPEIQTPRRSQDHFLRRRNNWFTSFRICWRPSFRSCAIWFCSPETVVGFMFPERKLMISFHWSRLLKAQQHFLCYWDQSSFFFWWNREGNLAAFGA